MSIWVTVAVYAAIYVINRYTRPKASNARGDADSKPQQPRIGDGVPMALYYGIVQFDEPAVVWNSRITESPQKDRASVWGCNAVLVLGIPGGSQDSGPAASRITLRGMKVNDTVAPLEQLPGFPNWRLSGGVASFYVAAGAFSPASPSVGVATFEAGIVDTTATTRSFFEAAFVASDGDATLLPDYRFQTRFTLTGPFVWGSNPSFPSIRVEVHNPCIFDLGLSLPYLPWQMNRSKEANPIAVIYDLLTNNWGRLGLPASKIDTDSFTEAAQVLGSEGNGYSRILYDNQDAIDVIREILTQIDGVLFEDPVTRKLHVKLVRADYTAGTLPLFDEDNVLEVVERNTSTWSEVYNEVRVTYTDRRNNFVQRVAVAHDLAGISSQGGRVRALTVSYPGVSTEEQAQAIAARELAAVSIPMASLKIRVNRDGFDLRPGDVFRFTWPEFGITDAVYRLQHFDQGRPGEEGIVLDAIQDVFHLDPVFDGGTAVPEPQHRFPIEDRVFTEAPYWLQSFASSHDVISTAFAQHAMYLAKSPQPDSESFNAVERDDDSVRVVTDIDAGPYTPTGTLVVGYSRTLDPYDTSIGLFVNNLTDDSVVRDASADFIKRRGLNLVLVGGDEFMAFESGVPTGGGTFHLSRIWRGLLDTPPRTHLAGETVWFLSDAVGFSAYDRIGHGATLALDQSANGTMLPIVGGRSLDPADFAVETDRLVTRERWTLPYPVADLKVNGSKAPTITRDGAVVTLKRRNRAALGITRGDAGNEAVPETTWFVTNSQKVGPVNLQGPIINLVLNDQLEPRPTLTESGHGTIDVSVASLAVDRAIEFGGPAGLSWDAPSITVTAPHWRNLVANHDFANVLDYYQTGDPTYGRWLDVMLSALRSNDSNRLGGDGWYLTNADVGSDYDVQQTIRIDGYYPVRMRAVLDFYERAIGTPDIDDTIQVDLQALSSTNSVLATATYGPLNGSSTWTRRTLQITNLPTGTVKILVRVRGVSFDEPPFTDIGFTEPVLRVGQITSQLITNGGFDVNLTGWTTSSGSFVRDTVFPFSGAGYARGGTGFTSNELRQTVTVPAGYEYGTAVLFWAQRDTDLLNDGDLGQVVMEALDGSAAVVATTSSTAAEYATFWRRNEMTLDLPGNAVQVRVRLIATQVSSAGTAGAGFDDVDLRIHKKLDPSHRTDLDFRTPSTQRAPRNAGEWREAFPLIPIPDYGIYNGEPSLEGALGIEPPLSWPGQRTGAAFRGLRDPDAVVTSPSDLNCYEFAAADTGGAEVGDLASIYGNFSSSDSFTAVVFFRSRARAARAAGLVGRAGASTGWSLHVNTSGFVEMAFDGASFSSVARAMATHDGAPHMAALTYDGVTKTATVIDESGASGASIAGIGEFKCDEDVALEIGRMIAGTAGSTLDGQIARVYLWRQALTTPQVQSLWVHGASPAGTTVSSSARTGALVVLGPNDAAGNVTLVSQSSRQTAYAYVSGGWGVANNLAVTNLAPLGDLRDAALWPRDPNADVVTDGFQSPLGFLDALRLEGNNDDYLEGVQSALFTLAASPATVTVRWYARTDAGLSITARIRLENSAETVLETYDYSVYGEWLEFQHTFTTWDGSTAQARIHFYASNDGNLQQVLYLAGPIYVGQSTASPIGLPYTATVGASTITLTTALPATFNSEGEVVAEVRGVEGAPGVQRDIVTVDNGTNNNDARVLRHTSGNAPAFLHYDGSAGLNTATGAVVSWSTSDRKLRGRWSVAELIEAAATFSGLRVDTGTVVGGRAAYWGVSTTALARTILGASNLLVRRVVLFARECNLGQDF